MLISAQNVNGLSDDEIIEILKQSIKGRSLNNVLIIPPDITRFHSKAGFITNCCYHLLREKGVHVDILPALGTHAPMSEAELDKMFGDIPKELFMVHHWRDDVIKIGTVNRNYINEISEGIFEEDIAVEVNRYVVARSDHIYLYSRAHIDHFLSNKNRLSFTFLHQTSGHYYPELYRIGYFINLKHSEAESTSKYLSLFVPIDVCKRFCHDKAFLINISVFIVLLSPPRLI